MGAAELIAELLTYVQQLTIEPAAEGGVIVWFMSGTEMVEFRGTLVDALGRAHAVAMTPRMTAQVLPA